MKRTDANRPSGGTVPPMTTPHRASLISGTPAVGPGREPLTIAGTFPGSRETFAPVPDHHRDHVRTDLPGRDDGSGSGFDPGGREGVSPFDGERRRGRRGGHAIDSTRRPNHAMRDRTRSRLRTAPRPSDRPRQGAQADGLVIRALAPTRTWAGDAGTGMTTGGNRREKERAADAPTSTARSRSRICTRVSRPR